MSVKWEEPEPRIRKFGRRGAWQDEADQLRAHPGRWGVVAEYSGDEDKKLAYGLAGHIRGGGYVAFRPKGEFESFVQTEADGSRKVFARFLGEGGGHAEAEAAQAPSRPRQWHLPPRP
jgi:hypothetical protein